MEDDGGGGGVDPFDSLISLCHVSSSQEERLRRCPLAPEPYNPENSDESSESEEEEDEFRGGGIPMASTPIMLISPPPSDEEDNEFHTPPEEAAMSSSSELRAPAAELDGREEEEGVVDRRSIEEFDGRGETPVVAAAAVDLGRDSELGFREVEAAQRENTDSEQVRLNSEVFDAELNNSEERNSELEVLRVTPSDHGKRISAKRKLVLNDEGNSTEFFPQSNGCERMSSREFLEAMDVMRHDSLGETQEPRVVELRRLPCSIMGGTAEEEKGEESPREVTILDVLKLLAGDCDDDILSCSFLDICKRRGMEFPLPAWWSEKGTGFGDDDVEVGSF